MHQFDYSFLDNGLLPAGLFNITADIYSLRAMSLERNDQYNDVYTALEEIAKIQSVKSSNEIEGIVTTDERIREIVNENSAPLNHSEQEIAGYRDALAQIHTGYRDID
ncbi:MAG: Fic family protein, partial [Eubacterium sp.]|nr:Fic family protein [Eubacterium sp.]